MLISHVRHFLQHLHFFLIILSSLSVSAFAADRRFCGHGLADTLRFLCNGKYKTRLETGSDGIASTSGGVSDSLTQQCCQKPCGMATLMTYCAGPPDAQMGNMLSRLSHTSNVNRNLPKTSSGAALLAGEISPSGVQPKSRLSGLLNGKHTFDVSPYSETGLGDIYQSLPSRQR